MSATTDPAGFAIYDRLEGPDLDSSLWASARMSLPTGQHIPLDPTSQIEVGTGEVTVSIPRFSLSSNAFQSADSPKYLVYSTHWFEVSVGRPGTFAVDLSVENVGGEPADYRQAMAAFHVFDLESTRRVFAVCATSTRVFALHEHLPLDSRRGPPHFQHVIESPYEDFGDDFTRPRACEVTLDRSRETATWRVDDHSIYEAGGTQIPERVQIGFGIWTMLPIREGRSQSLKGQGMNARWRRFRLRGVDT